MGAEYDIKQRPYICKFCTRGFTMKNNLYTHLKKFHSDDLLDKGGSSALEKLKMSL